jgi:transposase
MARHTGARFSGKRLRELPQQERTPWLADEPQGLAVTSRLVGLDGLQQQSKTLDKTVQKRRPHPPSYEPRRTVQGLGTILAQPIPLDTGASSRCPPVGHSASSCRGVDSTKRSQGKRQGTGNGKNGTPYVAWASREAAQLALRLHPDAQRFSQRQLANTHTNTLLARKAVAHKLARACSDIRRALGPFAAMQAFGGGLFSRGGAAGGGGKSWGTSTRADEPRSQPLTDGPPPKGGVVRRLGREPWEKWTREGAT